MSTTQDDRHIKLAVTKPFKASREQMWKGLVDKIRAPEKYVGSRDVHIDADTPEYVDRRMTVGPPTAPMNISERITWNEKEGRVTFTMKDDPTKEGKVENIITEKDGQLYLTFSFDWCFTDKASQAQVDAFRKGVFVNFQAATENAVAKTIEIVEAGGH